MADCLFPLENFFLAGSKCIKNVFVLSIYINNKLLCCPVITKTKTKYEQVWLLMPLKKRHTRCFTRPKFSSLQKRDLVLFITLKLLALFPFILVHVINLRSLKYLIMHFEVGSVLSIYKKQYTRTFGLEFLYYSTPIHKKIKRML